MPVLVKKDDRALSSANAGVKYACQEGKDSRNAIC
jgi:hypothetical protein